jgi:hypothetical protein
VRLKAAGVDRDALTGKSHRSRTQVSRVLAEYEADGVVQERTRAIAYLRHRLESAYALRLAEIFRDSF